MPRGVTYDPFTRGPFPVGVRTIALVDEGRDARPVPLELWYPATDAHAGADVAPDTRDTYELLRGFQHVSQDAVRDAAARPGRFPLVLFSHGYGGHRRQSTFLCTHLASHGYVVAAPDHSGNTMHDVMRLTARRKQGLPLPDASEQVRTFVEHRPADVLHAIAALERGGGPAVDVERMGVSGHSFGGWTTLMVARREPRVRAALALAPAGGRTPLGAGALQEALDLDWGREVPTLFLVAEHDSLLPLDGMADLFARVRPPKRMVVLRNADHMHFCDRAETVHEMFRIMPPPGGFAAVARQVRPMAELCPAAHAYDWIRGLGLAHFDAHLRGDERAAAFLAGDVRAALAARGIDADVG